MILFFFDCSPLFKQHLEGTAPKVTDGIYPDWDLFMKTTLEPNSIKQQHFTEQQAARWKGIEFNLGALQVRGLRFVFCFFYFDTNHMFLVYCCLILWKLGMMVNSSSSLLPVEC